MITDIRTTVRDQLMGVFAHNYVLLAQMVLTPFNDDYNQLNQIYQCHGNPNGKVYMNVPGLAICVDVDGPALYFKTQSTKTSNTGWLPALP